MLKHPITVCLDICAFHVIPFVSILQATASTFQGRRSYTFWRSSSPMFTSIWRHENPLLKKHIPHSWKHTWTHKHTSLRSSANVFSLGVLIIQRLTWRSCLYGVLSEFPRGALRCPSSNVTAPDPTLLLALIPETILHLMDRTFKLQIETDTVYYMKQKCRTMWS